MKENTIYFIKLLHGKNFSEYLEKNPKFTKKSHGGKNAIRYAFNEKNESNYDFFDEGQLCASFESVEIWSWEKDYAFIISKYNYSFNQENLANLQEAFGAFNYCNENHCDKLIMKEIFNSYTNSDEIEIIYPAFGSIEKLVYKTSEYEKYNEHAAESDEVFMLFDFDSNLSIDSDIIQQIKQISEGLVIDDEVTANMPLIELNDKCSFVIGNIGCGIIKRSAEGFSLQHLLISFLDAIKETAYYKFATDENNKILDQEVKKFNNLELEKSKYFNAIRESVHIKNKIRRLKRNYDIGSIFFALYMENSLFAEYLDEFTETTEAIKNEIDMEVSRRDEKRRSFFDKICDLVGVFAVVSLFKDGSDLWISMVQAIQQGTPLDIGSIIINLISIICPIISLVLIIIFVKIMKDDK